MKRSWWSHIFQPAFCSVWSFSQWQASVLPRTLPGPVPHCQLFFSSLCCGNPGVPSGADFKGYQSARVVQVPLFMLHRLPVLLKIKGFQLKFSASFLLGEDTRVAIVPWSYCALESPSLHVIEPVHACGLFQHPLSFSKTVPAGDTNNNFHVSDLFRVACVAGGSVKKGPIPPQRAADLPPSSNKPSVRDRVGVHGGHVCESKCRALYLCEIVLFVPFLRSFFSESTHPLRK